MNEFYNEINKKIIKEIMEYYEKDKMNEFYNEINRKIIKEFMEYCK